MVMAKIDRYRDDVYLLVPQFRPSLDGVRVFYIHIETFLLRRRRL
jgi:hypothetical protein